MRLASYNVENLFERAVALDLPSRKDSSAVLKDWIAFSELIAKDNYTTSDRAKMVEILTRHNLHTSSGRSKVMLLRQNRGKLLSKAKSNKPAAIIANGRRDWVGWLELKRGQVNSQGIENTARVIKELGADVLGVVEADDRPGLKRFNELMLGSNAVGGEPYHHVMLIDGNDMRGIDVGIMTRKRYPIVEIRSYVEDRNKKGRRIFSRDCAGYKVATPSGNHVWVLVNHFKSKGYGNMRASNARREGQAVRARQIYNALLKDTPFVAVIGDLNDTPASEPLKRLLQSKGAPKDVSVGPSFDDGGRPGTYANCTKSNKIDYVLCSPELHAKMTRGGIDRRGVWGGKHGTLFAHMETIESKIDSASDHAAIWADFDV